MIRPSPRFFFLVTRALVLAVITGLWAYSVNAEPQNALAPLKSESGLPEKELGKLCDRVSRAYVEDFVEKRDRGLPQQEALASTETDWVGLRRRASLEGPYGIPPFTEAEQAHLRRLASKLSILAYKLPKASSEVLSVVVAAQCLRARKDQRLLTIDELRIAIYGTDACAADDRSVRYSCLYSFFSPTAKPTLPGKRKIEALTLNAFDVGLETLFPKATISFTPNDSIPLGSGYRFSFDIGDENPKDSKQGMAYLAGPYKLFWCGMQHLGNLIGRDIVLTKIDEQKGLGGNGLAIFVDADDSFSSFTKGPFGGEWLSIMPLNRIQTTCEKQKRPDS